MALFGSGGYGFSLKALLEDPNLQNPPKLNSGLPDLKKGGNRHGNYVSNANSAFLGPNLWEKQGGDNNNDFDLEYMDLDEFLSENGIPINTEETDDTQTISLLANALAQSPPSSPNPRPIRISPPSPENQSKMSPSRTEVTTPPIGNSNNSSSSNNNLGLYMPESPIRQTVSPISFQSGSPAPSSPSAIERCLLDDTFGVKINLPEEKSPVAWESDKSSTVTKGTDSEVDFQVKDDDLSLVTIPVLRQESYVSDGISYPEQYPEQWDSDSENESQDSEGQLIQNNIPGQANFDPKKRKFSSEELKPQPIIKKSKKVFVDDSAKDDRYWARRKKNNIAAKRSRDARRVKENQIAMRAAFLEQESDALRQKFAVIQKENESLKKRLSKYETV